MRTKTDVYYDLLEKVEKEVDEISDEGVGGIIVEYLEKRIKALYIAYYEAKQNGALIKKEYSPERIINKSIAMIKNMYVNEVLQTLYIDKLKSLRV